MHVRINDHGDRILRRPFSIHDCAGETLSLVYKVVGHGTKELSELAPGAVCDLLGPLGVGFSDPAPGMTPVLVAGDTVRQRLTCSQSRSRSADLFLLGARSESDVLLTEKYEKAGYEVRVATNDGSMGYHGFVTGLVEQLLAEKPDGKVLLLRLRPASMLMALAKLLARTPSARGALDRPPHVLRHRRLLRLCGESQGRYADRMDLCARVRRRPGIQSRFSLCGVKNIMADLTCNLGRLTLKNPVMTASGTFGYGYEYHQYYDISRLGAVVVKGIRMSRRPETRRRASRK